MADIQNRDDDQIVVACLAPSGANRSRRQERLSRDARDLLAWAFNENFPVSDLLPLITLNAVELKIGDDDCDYIAYGNDGFVQHGGADDMRYMKHADDEDWAIVFANDCDGDIQRGADVVGRYISEEREK